MPAGGSQVGFFGELALRGVEGILTVDVEQAGGYLPEVHAHRVSVLVEHQQFVVFVEHGHGHGTGHLHHIAGEYGVLVQLVFLNRGFDDVSAVFDGPGANRAFGGFVDNMLVFAHISILEGLLRNSLVYLSVTQRATLPDGLKRLNGERPSRLGDGWGAQRVQSPYAPRRSRAALIRPAKSGCGRVGRERYSGCA